MKMGEIAFNSFEPLWLKVYQPVRERILKGYLLPGAMLSENQLAEEFEVNAMPTFLFLKGSKKPVHVIMGADVDGLTSSIAKFK